MRCTPFPLGGRSRPLVALVVLTAWIATLLVAGPASNASATPGVNPPPAPTDFTVDAATGSTNPTFRFVLEDPSTDRAQCALVVSGAGAPTDGWATCDSPWTPTITADGTYDGYVRTVRTLTTVQDPAASPTVTIDDVKTSDPAGPVSYTLATTPPPPALTQPVVTFATPGSTTVGPAATFAFSVPDYNAATDTLECGTAAAGTDPATVVTTPCTSPYEPFAGAASGSYAVVVKVTRTDGTVTYTDTDVLDPIVLDATRPVLTVTQNATPANAPSWDVSVNDATVTPLCSLTGVTTSAEPCGPTFSKTLTTAGTYTLTVTATDGVGNDATPYTQDYVYRQPSAPTVTVTPSTGSRLDVSFSVTGTGSYGVSCVLTAPSTYTGPLPTVSCAAPTSTVTLPAGADGDWTLAVRATDANYTSAPGSATYTLDTTGPGAPTVTGPAGTSNSAQSATQATFTVTPATGTDHVDCEVLQNGAFSYAVPDCTSVTVTMSGEGSTWTVVATPYDSLDNPGTPGSGPTVTYDPTPPSAPTVTAPASPSNVATGVWSFSTSEPATFRCVWTVGTAAPDWSKEFVCQQSGPLTVPGGEGVYTLHVVAVDSAGTRSTSAGTGTYVYDTTKPAAPSISTTSRAASSSPSITWTLAAAAEVGPRFECQLLQQGANGTYAVVAGYEWAACDTPYTVGTLPGEGTYALQARTTDSAGNTGPEATSSPYLYDKTPPLVPMVDGPTGPSKVRSVTWTITKTDDADTLECQYVENGVPQGDFIDCGTSVSRADLADGTYALNVREVDAALNVSSPVVQSPTYVVDNLGPAAPTFTGADSTGKTESTSWTFSGEPLAKASCVLYFDGVAQAAQPAACASGDVFDLRAGDGRYQVEVLFTDVAGNPGTAAKSPTYLLDTAAPAVPTVTGPVGPTGPIDNVTAVSYSFTREAGSTATCQLMQRLPGSSTWSAIQTQTLCAATWNVTLPSIDADYTARVTLTDAALNTGAYGESGIYTLDVTGPDPAAFVTGPTGTANAKAVTWAWTYEDKATATCSVTYRDAQGARVIVAPEPCNSGIYSTSLTAGDGEYTLTVALTDQYGNLGASVTSAPYTLDATAPGAPVVTGPSVTSNKTTVDYSYGGPVEAGTTAECRLNRDLVVAEDWHPCSLPRSMTLGVDGSYVLDVRLTDPYKNTGLPGSSPAYVLDTKLPTVPVVTAPTSPSSNAAPTFTFVVDADTRASCSLTRGTTVVGAAASCTGSFTGALTGLADGDYVLTVTSRDAAGNIATGSSAPYTYDTTAPVPPSVTGPTGPSQNRTPVFSWSGEAGAKAECSAQEKLGTPGPWVACATPYAPTLPSDGTWVLSVRLTDLAGNVSGAGASGGYLLDTTAPLRPNVTAPSSPGRDLAPSWSADTEPGSRIECRFTGPGQITAGFAGCTLPMDTPVSTDGEYTLEVRATDAAGNVSEIGVGTYVLDTTAPAAPVVTQPTGPGRSRTPSIAFTTEAGTTGSCRLTRGTTVLSESAACSSPALLDLTGLPDGAYTLTVRAIDAAGNTGPASTGTYVLDTTAPAAPTFTLVPGSPSSDRAPVYAFAAEAGSVLACRLTTAAGVRDLVCASPLTLDLSGSADGDYTLAVTARDAAGNVSAPATSTFVLSSTAPAAPRVVGPTTPGSTRTPTWRISSTSPAECRLVRGTTTLKDWSPCGTSYTADLYAQPDAVYLFEARVIGSTAATASRYRLDTAGPAAATLTAPPSPSTVRKPTWAVASAETGVTAECRVTVFGGVLQDWAPCAVSSAGSLFSYDLTGLGDGTYTLSVRLTDASGNLGAVATSDYVLDTSAPAAVGVVAPPSPGNDTTPTWTLSSTTGAKLECRITSGQKLLTDFAPCATSYTADLTGLPDGTYTMTVHALSAAGTPGPETTSSYILDTTAAEAPGTLTGPTGPSRDRSPTWTFVLAPGSTAICKVTSNGATFRDGPCTSPFTLDLSSAPDGSYTLTVRAVDAAGNLGPASTAGYILRTVPAPAPVFTQEPGSPSSTTDPRWGFSTVRGVTTECRILYGGKLQDDWVSCTNPYTMLLTGKPDGTYTLQVRAVDEAQNTSSVITSDYVFDRTAPALAVFVDTPESPGNDTSPTWVVSAPTAPVTTTAPALIRTAALTGATSAECRLTARGSVGGWTPCSGSYTATTSGDGSYVLEVRATDGAGATGPISTSRYVLDTSAPLAPRFSESPPPVGNEAEVSWSWADDPVLLVECRFLKGGVPTGAFAPCRSPYTASLTRLGQNTYTLEARAVDLAGNISPVGATSYRFDTTPPPAPVFVTRPAARGTATAATWTFAVPVDTTAVCVVTRDGTVIAEGACAGSYTIERMSQAATYALSVKFVDAAGNIGPPTVGSYTLTTPVLVRDRVDGPSFPGPGGGAGPFTPRPVPGIDTGSGPGTGLVPAAPVPGSRNIVRDPDQPKPGAFVRAVAPLKRAVRNAVKALPVPAVPGIPEGTRVPDAIKNALESTITKPQLPLALFVIVLLFLLVQNRIDRRDPKLAVAPVETEPELEFGPRVRTTLRAGGATA